MAYCSVKSAALHGVVAQPVDVEVDISRGLPEISIIGMPDTELLESREKVRCAIRAAGFTVPNEKIVINLAPATLKKRGFGPAAIAVGILAASGQIPRELVEGRLFAGELTLDGRVIPVRGTMAYALAAKRGGLALVTSAGCKDAVALEGVEQLGIKSLADLRTGRALPLPTACAMREEDTTSLDFKDVCGHEAEKRALQIAAAGGHGVILVGPPSSGKTMLASRVPSILPPMSQEERLQTALIRSTAGKPVDTVISGTRPFRAPHHSVSLPGMVGGGNPVMPGEISLAHGGVLFLSEIQAFKPTLLQAVRQSIETGEVRIVRADGATDMPAKPKLLLATARPCPCGHYGDSAHDCTCSEQLVREYQGRLGGPLTDCIDMQIDVRRSSLRELLNGSERASSAELRNGVIRAQEFASQRDHLTGERDGIEEALRYCFLDCETMAFLDKVATKRNMGNTSIARTLKVARTIADLEESHRVKREHIAEAISLLPRFGCR